MNNYQNCDSGIPQAVAIVLTTMAVAATAATIVLPTPMAVAAMAVETTVAMLPVILAVAAMALAILVATMLLPITLAVAATEVKTALWKSMVTETRVAVTVGLSVTVTPGMF